MLRHEARAGTQLRSEPADIADRGFSPLQSATWRIGWCGRISTGFVQQVASSPRSSAGNDRWRVSCVEFRQI